MRGAIFGRFSMPVETVPAIKTGPDRFRQALSIPQCSGDMLAKVVLTSILPDGEPEIHETAKRRSSAPSFFLFSVLNTPRRFKAETQTKKGKRDGRTQEIKSSNPAAAPRIEL